MFYVNIRNCGNFLTAAIFSIRYIEVIGLLFTVILFTFSSSGGSWTRYIDSKISAQTGIILEKEPFFFRMNPALLVSILYTIIGLIIFILLISIIIL
ncbi:hypothetical protein CWS01_13785 [Niallia nealsonii]|uniref:Uncharacterized protein n=1 Tax=Niallia nealsonii TaxID=115979 RepID=A0A2N0Z0W0_9BACI|nr:hypothetical protein CWS01_13785 [Niallia nealsonii]